jgi:hypothetical protein
MACELLRRFYQISSGCVVVGYHETSVEYVVRLRHGESQRIQPEIGARLEVRLTKDGDNATVMHLPVP